MVLRKVRDAITAYPFKRLVAWVLDILFVTFICALAFGPSFASAVPRDVFLVSVGSAIVGFVYFLAFSLSASRTPGLMIARGSLVRSKRSAFLGAGLFASMLLPFGVVLLVLDPIIDVFGSLGVEVRV